VGMRAVARVRRHLGTSLLEAAKSCSQRGVERIRSFQATASGDSIPKVDESLRWESDWESDDTNVRQSSPNYGGANLLCRTPAAERFRALHESQRLKLSQFDGRLQFVFDDIMLHHDEYPRFVQQLHILGKSTREQRQKYIDQSAIGYDSRTLLEARKVIFALFYIGLPTTGVVVMSTRSTVASEILTLIWNVSNGARDSSRPTCHPVVKWISKFGLSNLYAYALESLDSPTPSTFDSLSARRETWWRRTLTDTLDNTTT